MEIKIEINSAFRIPSGTTADVARKGLLWIENKKRKRISREFPDGWITNEEIIAEGTREGSDVWPLFWHDDEVIRSDYLHQQANFLARCYQATIIREDGTRTIHNPANVIYRPAEGGSYFRSPMSINDEHGRDQVLGECLDLLKSVQNRLAKIQAALEEAPDYMEYVNRAIDAMEQERAKRRKRKAKRQRQNAVGMTG